MTTLTLQPFGCRACGAPGERVRVDSTNEFGASDLDTRPPEMRRSTMPYWVVVCGACGYAFDPHADSDRTPDAELLGSEEYQAQLADPTMPELASGLLCRALFVEADGDLVAAGWSVLAAAWACDDERHAEGAERCRIRTAALWQRAFGAGEQIIEPNEAVHAVLADVLRRAGRFDAAAEECERGLMLDGLDSPLRMALTYTQRLVACRDRSRHSFDDLRGGPSA